MFVSRFFGVFAPRVCFLKFSFIMQSESASGTDSDISLQKSVLPTILSITCAKGQMGYDDKRQAAIDVHRAKPFYVRTIVLFYLCFEMDVSIDVRLRRQKCLLE